MAREVSLTYIGGPTLLLEAAGFRLLFDPTLDPAPSEYPTPVYTLRKRIAPVLPAGGLEPLSGVLLSHDHHFDNLDRAGRDLLHRVPVVYTTGAGAERLGPPARGLAPWETATLTAGGRTLRVTATPARHGPPGGDRGPVIGFVLELDDAPGSAVYVSGDTVWYEGVEEVGRRFPVSVAILNLGAAKVAVAGPEALTFTAEGAVELARAWPEARIVPAHFEGWEHFTEGRTEIETAFRAAGLEQRLVWLPAGESRALPLGG